MFMVTRVKAVVAETPEIVIPNLRMALYDRDLKDEDDFLDSGMTDDRGEILFKFDSEQYTDSEDEDLWRLDSLPDLYVVALNAAGDLILTTRPDTVQDKLPDLITVPISQELVDEHQLLPGE